MGLETPVHNTMGVMTITKTTLLLNSFREAAILIIAAIEDYADTPYDKSALAKRRETVRRHTP